MQYIPDVVSVEKLISAIQTPGGGFTCPHDTVDMEATEQAAMALSSITVASNTPFFAEKESVKGERFAHGGEYSKFAV